MKKNSKENRALDFAFRCVRVLERKYNLIHVLVRQIDSYEDDVALHAIFSDFVLVFLVYSHKQRTDVILYKMLTYTVDGKFITTKTKAKKWEKAYFF